MASHISSDQSPAINTNSKNLGPSTPQSAPIGSEPLYEALWNESKKGQPRSQQELSQWTAKLRRELGSQSGIKAYFEWVRSRQPKAKPYVLNPGEIKIDLKSANWKEGNSSLLNLNSRLSHSITAYQSADDSGLLLHAMRKTIRLGLRIHGRPLAISPSDHNKCEEMGITVNSELVLAVIYHGYYRGNFSYLLETKTMLFVPLGRILINSTISNKWLCTEIALTARICDDGKAGGLYLIFPQGIYNAGDSEVYARPSAISDAEWKELQDFQNGISFTVARVVDTDGYALLGDSPGVPVPELVTETISQQWIEVVETGSKATEPGMPFALYPRAQYT